MAIRTEVESLSRGPEQTLNKAYVALKISSVADTRIMRHLPRRAAHRKWNQPQREMYDIGSKSARRKPYKSFEMEASDSSHGT